MKTKLKDLKIHALMDAAQLIRTHVEYGEDYGYSEEDLDRFDKVCKRLADRLDREAERLNSVTK